MGKIAIIGASYLQLPLVLRCKEMGHQTICFAWEEGAVCKDVADSFYPISILDKEAVLKKCRELGIEGIATIATDIAVPTVSYVGEKLGLIANSYASALASTNKTLMRKRFLQSEVKSPRFIEVNPGDQAFFVNFDFPMMVKPVDRSGSRGVSKVNNALELGAAIRVACNISFAKKCIIEEYIEGVEVSVESISWKGKHHILAITDKVTTNAPYFVEIAHHQPSRLEPALLEKIKKETVAVLDALSIDYGAGHSEFKITKGGDVYVIEVGARMGGDFIGSHLVKLSTGYDFLAGVIEVAMNNFNSPVFQNCKVNSGVYFLCKETEKIKVFFDQRNDFDVEKLVQNSILKNIRNSNERSGYLIYNSGERIDLLSGEADPI
jgi:biotin carboxylase